MNETMKAMRLYAANDYRIEEIPIPQIGESEMLVKVKCTAFCGTDIKILEGKKTKDVRYPSTTGHEISGEVCAVGPAVEGFAVGDRVAIANVLACGKCEACKRGHENVCMDRKAIGYEFDGGFAQYIRVPDIYINSHVLKMPDTMSYRAGALIEPLSCCIRGQKNAGVADGRSVVVVGAGPIGLMHTGLAKAAGASFIIVIEPNDARRNMAQELGADYVYESLGDEAREKINELTNGYGVDIVIMAAGITGVLNDALDIIGKGGNLNLFAGFPKDVLAEIDVNKIHYKEINVNGSSAYKIEDYREAFALVADKKFEVDRLVTHAYSLDEFKLGYEMSKSGKGLKVVIEEE